MAFEAGELVVKVTANTDDFERKVQKVDSDASKKRAIKVDADTSAFTDKIKALNKEHGGLLSTISKIYVGYKIAGNAAALVNAISNKNVPAIMTGLKGLTWNLISLKIPFAMLINNIITGVNALKHGINLTKGTINSGQAGAAGYRQFAALAKEQFDNSASRDAFKKAATVFVKNYASIPINMILREVIAVFGQATVGKVIPSQFRPIVKSSLKALQDRLLLTSDASIYSVYGEADKKIGGFYKSGRHIWGGAGGSDIFNKINLLFKDIAKGYNPITGARGGKGFGDYFSVADIIDDTISKLLKSTYKLKDTAQRFVGSAYIPVPGEPGANRNIVNKFMGMFREPSKRGMAAGLDSLSIFKGARDVKIAAPETKTLANMVMKSVMSDITKNFSDKAGFSVGRAFNKTWDSGLINKIITASHFFGANVGGYYMGSDEGYSLDPIKMKMALRNIAGVLKSIRYIPDVFGVSTDINLWKATSLKGTKLSNITSTVSDAYRSLLYGSKDAVTNMFSKDFISGISNNVMSKLISYKQHGSKNSKILVDAILGAPGDMAKQAKANAKDFTVSIYDAVKTAYINIKKYGISFGKGLFRGLFSQTDSYINNKGAVSGAMISDMGTGLKSLFLGGLTNLGVNTSGMAWKSYFKTLFGRGAPQPSSDIVQKGTSYIRNLFDSISNGVKGNQVFQWGNVLFSGGKSLWKMGSAVNVVKNEVTSLVNNSYLRSALSFAGSHLGDILMGGMAAAIGLGTAKVIVGLAKITGERVAIEKSFRRLSTFSNIDSSSLMVQMRKASGNTISDNQLMKMANTANLLKVNMTELPGLIQLAKASAAAMGEEVDFMFESIVKGTARMSPMILDNLGLTMKVSAGEEKYAAGIGKTVDALTEEEKRQAFLNTLLENKSEILAKVGTEWDTASTAASKLENIVDSLLSNFLTKVGEQLLPVMMRLVDATQAFVDAFSRIPMASAALDGLLRFLSLILQSAAYIVTVLARLVSGIMSIAQLAVSAFSALSLAIQGEFTMAGAVVAQAWNGVGEAFLDLVKDAKKYSESAWETISKDSETRRNEENAKNYEAMASKRIRDVAGDNVVRSKPDKAKLTADIDEKLNDKILRQRATPGIDSSTRKKNESDWRYSASLKKIEVEYGPAETVAKNKAIERAELEHQAEMLDITSAGGSSQIDKKKEINRKLRQLTIDLATDEFQQARLRAMDERATALEEAGLTGELRAGIEKKFSMQIAEINSNEAKKKLEDAKTYRRMLSEARSAVSGKGSIDDTVFSAEDKWDKNIADAKALIGISEEQKTALVKSMERARFIEIGRLRNKFYTDLRNEELDKQNDLVALRADSLSKEMMEVTIKYAKMLNEVDLSEEKKKLIIEARSREYLAITKKYGDKEIDELRQRLEKADALEDLRSKLRIAKINGMPDSKNPGNNQKARMLEEEAYNRELQNLEMLLASKQIKEDEYRLRRETLEQEHSNRMQEIARNETDAVIQERERAKEKGEAMVSGLINALSQTGSGRGQALISYFSQNFSPALSKAAGTLKSFGAAHNAAMKDGGKSPVKIGKAFKEMGKDMIDSLKETAIVQTVLEMAEGFKSLANLDFRGAALHFASSALFGAVAGMQIAGAMGGGNSGDSGSSKDNLGTGKYHYEWSDVNINGTTTATADQPVNVTINAMDSQSFSSFAKRNSAALAGAVNQVVKSNAPVRRTMGRNL